jgi:hypothetical protein
VSELAAEREFLAGRERDLVVLRFRSGDDLERGDLRQFIAEHLATLGQRVPQIARAGA